MANLKTFSLYVLLQQAFLNPNIQFRLLWFLFNFKIFPSISLFNCLAGALTLDSGEVFEINTTAPSIVKVGCTNCSYTASHQNRSSSHGDHLVADITFTENIEFRSGSIVKVSGKYALSITSQSGNILIHTDINMTCTETVSSTTCLGGYTQSSTPKQVGYEGAYTYVYQGKFILRCLFMCFCFLFFLLLRTVVFTSSK